MVVKRSLRRITATTDPYRDTRPGHTWSIDTITPRHNDSPARSRKGHQYLTVLRDHATGYFVCIFSWVRSDLTEQLRQVIRELRAHPYMSADKKYKLLSELHLDRAGEFTSDEWTKMCAEEGVVCCYSSPPFEMRQLV